MHRCVDALMHRCIDDIDVNVNVKVDIDVNANVNFVNVNNVNVNVNLGSMGCSRGLTLALTLMHRCYRCTDASMH